VPNKRMQLAGASGLRSVGLCVCVKKSPQLMRGPLGRCSEQGMVLTDTHVTI
jgi:hypothetical protein